MVYIFKNTKSMHFPQKCTSILHDMTGSGTQIQCANKDIITVIPMWDQYGGREDGRTGRPAGGLLGHKVVGGGGGHCSRPIPP